MDFAGESISLASQRVLLETPSGQSVRYLTIAWSGPPGPCRLAAPAHPFVGLTHSDRGVSWDKALAKYHECRAEGREACFYRSRQPYAFTGTTTYLLAIPHAQSVLRSGRAKSYTVLQPNTGCAVPVHGRKKTVGG